jgi:hypothetical protein
LALIFTCVGLHVRLISSSLKKPFVWLHFNSVHHRLFHQNGITRRPPEFE